MKSGFLEKGNPLFCNFLLHVHEACACNLRLWNVYFLNFWHCFAVQNIAAWLYKSTSAFVQHSP